MKTQYAIESPSSHATFCNLLTLFSSPICCLLFISKIAIYPIILQTLAIKFCVMLAYVVLFVEYRHHNDAKAQKEFSLALLFYLISFRNFFERSKKATRPKSLVALPKYMELLDLIKVLWLI